VQVRKLRSETFEGFNEDHEDELAFSTSEENLKMKKDAPYFLGGIDSPRNETRKREGVGAWNNNWRHIG
jgi:hypothetical protein